MTAPIAPREAQIAPREIRPTLDTSRDGALLLHGSDRGHHPELDHPKPSAKRTKPIRLPLGYLKGFYDQVVIVSADHLYRFETGKPWVYASAAHPSRFQIPMGDAGKFPGISGAQPSFQTADGAQKILAANGRSVTRAFPGVVEITIPGASTTGKPVDTGAETRNVSRTSRIGQQAIDFPEILKIRGMATEVRFTHIGAGNFSYASGKAGNPALAPNTPFRGAFPQSVEKGGDSLHLRKCGGRP